MEMKLIFRSVMNQKFMKSVKQIFSSSFSSIPHQKNQFLKYFPSGSALTAIAAATTTVGLYFITQNKNSIHLCDGDDNNDDDHDNSKVMKRTKSIKKKYLTNNSIADAAAVILPCVVNIISHQGGFLPLTSAGSGFIISKDGHILTNAHVVSHVKQGGIVDITLADLRRVHGRVHSVDTQSDLAIIQIDDPNVNLNQLPIAKFGRSANLRAGEFVIAVGSPLQLRESVSFGIISAPARHCSEIGMVKCGYVLSLFPVFPRLFPTHFPSFPYPFLSFSYPFPVFFLPFSCLFPTLFLSSLSYLLLEQILFKLMQQLILVILVVHWSI
jgi:hypothetical protein